MIFPASSAGQAVSEYCCLERAIVLVHQPALDGNRPLEGRLAMGHDGVMRRPRRGREAVVPDLTVTRVGVADHMEGRGLRGACGDESGGGNEGGSSEGTNVMHGYLLMGCLGFSA